MKGPQVAVGAVITDEQGRVLLIQRGHPPAQGRWTIPGGRVEAGETLAAALARELAAETGLTAEQGPLLEVFEYIDDSYHYVILDYRMARQVGQLRAGDDAQDARYYTMAEIEALATTDGLLPFLRRALGR